MKLTKEEDKVICKFLKSASDEGGKSLFRLMQFVLMKLSEDAIQMNAAEVVFKSSYGFRRRELQYTHGHPIFQSR